MRPVKPAPPEQEDRLAIEVWQLLGCRLDWAGLEVVAEMKGIDDIEALVIRLAAIREWNEKRN